MKIKTMCKETVNGFEIPRKLIFDGKTLIIKTPFSKTNDERIPAENIQECVYKKETELEQSNSVIGRAIAGGLLFGDVGAVVGGMSGLKQKKVNRFFLVVSYDCCGGNIVRAFEDYPNSKTYKIAEALRVI